MATTSVLIADDHPVFRAGLRMLLDTQPDLQVVGEASTAREALDLVLKLEPNVLSLDLSMPGGGSVKIMEKLREECPNTRIIVLTMHDEPAYMHTVIAAGGLGYVVKTAVDSDLLHAIRAVARGETFVDSRLASQGSSPSMRDAIPGQLSQREREVLEQLAKGYTNREIAERMFISSKTVETYRARIADKLNIRSRADIIRYAMESGILAPDSSPPK